MTVARCEFRCVGPVGQVALVAQDGQSLQDSQRVCASAISQGDDVLIFRKGVSI